VLAELILAASAVLAIDGDTLLLDGERLRLFNVDTPEIHCRCESECRAAWAAKRFTQDTLNAGRVEIRRTGKDRYGRTLAYVTVNGRDLGELIIAAGHGRPYHGERRQSWCN
jgi:endonuclease YncB( thermonuclease family)